MLHLVHLLGPLQKSGAIKFQAAWARLWHIPRQLLGALRAGPESENRHQLRQAMIHRPGKRKRRNAFQEIQNDILYSFDQAWSSRQIRKTMPSRPSFGGDCSSAALPIDHSAWHGINVEAACSLSGRAHCPQSMPVLSGRSTSWLWLTFQNTSLAAMILWLSLKFWSNYC